MDEVGDCMNLYNNNLYLADIDYVANLPLPWDKLHNAHIVLSGSTGLLGSHLIDVIMHLNKDGLNCQVYALGRNIQKFNERFDVYRESTLLQFVPQDVVNPIAINCIETAEYVLHLASNTHPLQYATDPIGTITSNVIGLLNMLNFACTHNTVRFAFASSNEIYGETRHDADLFDESYCGYINSNTLRAGYPESKRCGESLCQAYKVQKNLDVVIPRFTRSYGPTMLPSDTKAISQFIKNGIAHNDIVLKSSGHQYYSYTYMTDAVCGLLYILLLGVNGDAYNIADESNDIRLKDLAALIAKYTNTSVVYDLPDHVEQSGYSTATIARLNGDKLKQLGWSPKYNIDSGVKRTIDILSAIT